MEKNTNTTRFEPSSHAITRLQERIYPGINKERAEILLRNLARNARPLKRSSSYGGQA